MYVGSLPFDLNAYPIFLVLGLLAGCVGLIFQMLVGLSAFWIQQVSPFYWIWEKLLFTLGGLLLPPHIYSGWIQLLMFTLIPAGVIGYLPVELLRHFSWLNLMILLGSAFGFFLLAFLVFHFGLKKYESGNQFGKIC